MSRKKDVSQKSRKNPSDSKDVTEKKFVLYVKVYDEFGFLEEDQCGWITFDDRSPKPFIGLSYKSAMKFTEKEHGHGNFEDWKSLFEEDYPNWKVTSKLYVTD